nr:glutaminyl-peptide cyclotransferase-like isoform X2 [Ipomoea batatas]
MKDGWGLATDGKVLYGSDGTSTLYQIDPRTKKVTRKQIVKYQGHQVPQLNELEYINDEVWANVWMAAQEIGQRFRETILALGGGKASLEVEIGTWLLDIDFWTLHPLTNTKDAN